MDDSTLDKLYSQKIDLVIRHRSGKHKRVVLAWYEIGITRLLGHAATTLNVICLQTDNHLAL